MANARDLLGHILGQLQTASRTYGRVQRIVFLVDWKACRTVARPVSSLAWVRGPQGPVSPMLETFVRASPDVRLAGTLERGGEGTALAFVGDPDFPTLSAAQRKLIDGVVAATDSLAFPALTQMVHDTYPVKSSRIGSEINLFACALAVRYAQSGRSLEAS
jgi:hypothetical protein